MSISKRTQWKYVKKVYRVRNWREYDGEQWTHWLDQRIPNPGELRIGGD